MEKDKEGTLKKSIRGGKWMFINTIFQKTITFGSFLILARLLAPEDFGIIAILAIVPGLLALITNPAFDTALIQRKEDPTPHLNAIWTFNVLKSLFIFVLIFLSAPLIAGFFHTEKALLAFRLSGLFVVLPALANSAQIFFFKEINFKKIFIRDLAGSASYAIIAIGLAMLYQSFWPLFWGTTALYCFTTLSTYWLHSFRPKLSLEFKSLSTLIRFSKWIYGQNIVDRIGATVENSLIAKMTGATATGLYTRAKSLAVMPTSPFYNIINRVTFPAYARIQDSYEKIRNGFLKSLDILFFVAIPFSVLILEAGYRIIFILLGEKWIEINLLLKILTLNITVSAFYITAMPILNAIGKPHTRFWLGLIKLLSFSLLFLLLIPLYGITGAALGLLISSSIMAILTLYKITTILSVKIMEIIKTFIIPLFSSLIILILGNFTLKYLEPISNTAFILLIISLGISYLAFIFLSGKYLKTGPWNTLKLILSETLQKKI